MKIYPPQLEKTGEKIIISSIFETNNYKDKLWYEFDIKYKELLVTEQSDAFVVGLLLLALRLKEDIYVNTISARLKYQLNHYLIPALCIAFQEFHKIKVYSEQENELILSKHESQSATGISCGVDSIATIIEHEKMRGQLQISHLTFFNAGSHGDFGGIYAREIFNKRYDNILEFANKISLPVIIIDTNLNELLEMRFVETHTLRNISCVLNLQKLFKNYYYASAFRFDNFKISDKISDLYDVLTLQMLSTESIKFYSSLSDKTREERTKLVSKYDVAFQYLDVCTNPRASKGKINCSKCDKCMRTQITLDCLGDLDNFRDVFHLDVYQTHKNAFISKIISNKNRIVMDRNVLKFITQNNIKITVLHVISSKILMLKGEINLIKKKLKKDVNQ
ncbi:hypothetical protein [Flavobacterium sp.]|uniref:hypothetical protein n=1 Tax=Flavobacterium sp. TaxID=239 RepID=UPI003C351DF0